MEEIQEEKHQNEIEKLERNSKLGSQWDGKKKDSSPFQFQKDQTPAKK